ncbi:mature parasite-infected erythrocyte surface antigen [Plasmodium falciparum IGH-CR14]|uniref:Mature parasite-infected erythrocyte surface antigen n=1 Tax=Plasmodium falciparum IGH-CR14 TaxID=580059 RepID=A0A0L1IC65_PLAFA|nr:mature parasite-infected erythrocyte surface antigen [Plasmodium falciparum IGH-CR14]
MKQYLSEQERLKLKIRNNYFEKNAIRSKIVNYLNRLTDLSIDHNVEDIKKIKQKRISSNENLDKLPEFKIEKRPKLEEDETTVNRNKRLLQIGLFDHLRKAKDALEQEKTDEKIIMHNLQNKRVEEKIHEVKRNFEKIELDDIEIKIIAYVKDIKMIEECIKQDEDKLMKLNLISHYEKMKNFINDDQNNIYENDIVNKSASHHNDDLEEKKCISVYNQKSDKRSMSVYSLKSDELNKDDKKNNSPKSENDNIVEDKKYIRDEQNQNECDYKNDDNKLMVCKNEESVLENDINENNSMEDTLQEKYYIKKDSRVMKEKNPKSPKRIKTESSDDSIKYVGDGNEKVVLKNNIVQEEEKKYMYKFFEGEENIAKSHAGEENTGKSYEGEENTGKSYEGEENTGKSYEGEENTGKSYEGEENTGKSNEGEENTGKSYEDEENTGKTYEDEENTGKTYEVDEKQKGKAKRGRPKRKSKRKGKIK